MKLAAVRLTALLLTRSDKAGREYAAQLGQRLPTAGLTPAGVSQ